jgi:hypothetical protein
MRRNWFNKLPEPALDPICSSQFSSPTGLVQCQLNSGHFTCENYLGLRRAVAYSSTVDGNLNDRESIELSV